MHLLVHVDSTLPRYFEELKVRDLGEGNAISLVAFLESNSVISRLELVSRDTVFLLLHFGEELLHVKAVVTAEKILEVLLVVASWSPCSFSLSKPSTHRFRVL